MVNGLCVNKHVDFTASWNSCKDEYNYISLWVHISLKSHKICADVYLFHLGICRFFIWVYLFHLGTCRFFIWVYLFHLGTCRFFIWVYRFHLGTCRFFIWVYLFQRFSSFYNSPHEGFHISN